MALGVVLAGKITGGGAIAPEWKVKERGSGAKCPKTFLTTPFLLQENAFLSTEIGSLYTNKLCK